MRSGVPEPEPDILDELDKRVIKILQDDGRRPNTDIAKELRVSETTVRKRISQLVSGGLINNVAVPRPRAVGLNLSAIIHISILLPRLRVAAGADADLVGGCPGGKPPSR